jgi:5-methylcytosine-specific restriction endonuclease McrA
MTAEKRRVSESLRRQARERAQGRCEYCLEHDEDAAIPHQADHVIAEKHGGATTLDNLAWACATCNLHKGTDLTSIDPVTGHITPLYNPRRQAWHRHFRVEGSRIIPKTASGRVTVFLLQLNDEWRLEEREGLISIGHYPRA